MGRSPIDLFSSLDGFAAADGWPGYWGKEGPDLMAWLEEKLAEDHALVMGANTYREDVADRRRRWTTRPSSGCSRFPRSCSRRRWRPPLTWANTQVAEDAVTTRAP